MLQLSRLHFGCCTDTHFPRLWTSHLSPCFSSFSHTTSSLSIIAEHLQVQVGEWHPPGRAPQAGVVRWQAGQLHLLHLQRQGDGRAALPGVVAEGKRLHLRPLPARSHATGQSAGLLWVAAHHLPGYRALIHLSIISLFKYAWLMWN